MYSRLQFLLTELPMYHGLFGHIHPHFLQRHVGLYPFHDPSHISYSCFSCIDCSCNSRIFQEIKSLFKLEKDSAKKGNPMSRTTFRTLFCSLDCSTSLSRQTQISASRLIDMDPQKTIQRSLVRNHCGT